VSLEQGIVLAVLAVALALFVWGRWRHDVVALAVLLLLVAAGVVPGEEAFDGFGNAAVITVAAVLVCGRALSNAGVVELLSRKLESLGGGARRQSVALCAVAATTSAFMNNVGALALLMPVAFSLARRHDLPPSQILMPLSFTCILGGLVTMIGTPPNILVADYLTRVDGQAFGLFDFTPVGLAVAVTGVAFVLLFGRFFLPRRAAQSESDDPFQIDDYITEVRVTDDSAWVGQTVAQIEDQDDGPVIVALVRDGEREPAPSRRIRIRKNDVLVLELDPTQLADVLDAGSVELIGDAELTRQLLRSSEVELMEFVVPPESSMVGRTPRQLRLRSRLGVNLLAIARQGVPVRRRLSHARLRPGDVVLLQGNTDSLAESTSELDLLPLAARELDIRSMRRCQTDDRRVRHAWRTTAGRNAHHHGTGCFRIRGAGLRAGRTGFHPHALPSHRLVDHHHARCVVAAGECDPDERVDHVDRRRPRVAS